MTQQVQVTSWRAATLLSLPVSEDIAFRARSTTIWSGGHSDALSYN